jgi:hypothetical protein
MTFFQVAKRHGWVVVDPLRDARECPDCLAAVYGRQSRDLHRQMHVERDEFDRQVLDALRRLAAEAGLTVGELPAAEDVDARLTRKARLVAGYEGEEDDDG